MSKKINDTIAKNSMKLVMLSRELYSLSKSFEMTGNIMMGDKLFNISDELQAIQEENLNSIKTMIEGVKDSQEMS